VNQSCGALVESGTLVETGAPVDLDGVNQSFGLNESGTQGLPSLPELESVLTAPGRPDDYLTDQIHTKSHRLACI
jgi:hypothetical protein